MLTRRLTLSAFALTALVLTARADDYPQWRGLERNGLSKETGLLPQWPANGPKVLWKLADLGYGFGTPAVAGNRLYVQTNTGVESEFVQALDATTGKKLWQTRIGKVGNPDQQPSYPASRSTPTVDGKLLYALGSDGDLACLESATGKIVWTKSLRTDFGGIPGTWAYAESPLVDGDALVCTPGGSTATLVALNKKTGAVIWRSAVPGADQACYASIVVATIGGVKQYVQFIRQGVVGVEAKTGKFLWRYEKTAQVSMGGNIPTPVVYGDYVYSASNLTGGGLAQIKAAATGFDTETVYFSKKLPSAIGGSVRVGDYLYGAGGSLLYCVELKTGKIAWEDRSVGPGSVVYADGHLYIHGENGALALVEATPAAYREKARFTPTDLPERNRTQAWSYPVIANGRLYIRDLGSLWCYDIKK